MKRIYVCNVNPNGQQRPLGLPDWDAPTSGPPSEPLAQTVHNNTKPAPTSQGNASQEPLGAPSWGDWGE